MKKVFKLAAILSFFIFVFAVKANAQAGVATVDTRILLMLHPLMMDFDYSTQRFYRETTKGKNSHDVWLLLDKARKDIEPKLEEFKAIEKKLENEKIEYVVALERSINRFAPGDIDRLKVRRRNLEETLKMLRSSQVTNKTQQEINKSKIDGLESQIQEIDDLLLDEKPENIELKKKKQAELREAIEALNEKIKENKMNRLEVEEQALVTVYLTTKETNERIEKAKNEIKELIQKAAKEGKFSMVLDTSFAMRSVDRKRRNNIISINDDSPDVVGASLFHYFSNLEDDPEIIKHLKQGLGEEQAQLHFVAGHSIGMQSNIKQYMEFRNYIPERAASFSNGKIFLLGGSDITTYVAKQIIDKYTIPNSTKELLSKTLRDYMNFEIEPYNHEVTY